MNKYKFECGCEFAIVDEQIKESDGLPHLKLDLYNIPLNCSKTWELLCSGNNKGVFQFESQLGKTWLKKGQPNDIEDIAALNALLRPGALKNIVDGKSTPQIWVDAKNGKQEVKFIHESLKDILQVTYGCLIFQEQSLAIARKLGGFSLEQADLLRKAMGKKKAELMTEVETQFLLGCQSLKLVSDEQAKEIFSFIRKSERYSFNKAHSTGYSLISYWTAYTKAHFPLHFFAAWLDFSKFRAKHKEELPELVSESRQFNLSILIPALCETLTSYYSLDSKKIKLGMTHIKGLGDKEFEKLQTLVSSLDVPLHSLTWLQTLTKVLNHIKKDVVNNLISLGCLDYIGISRKKMLYEYNIWLELTDREQLIASEKESLIDGLQYLLTKVTAKRAQIIDSLYTTLEYPTSSLEDSEAWMLKQERDLLGVEITNILPNYVSQAFTCSQISQLQNAKNVSLACRLNRASPYKIKNGKNKGRMMCFLTIEDNTGLCDNVVVFADQYEQFKNLLYKNAVVNLVGYIKEASFHITKVSWLN